MTRISCSCRICKGNNGGNPLHALIPATMPAMVYSSAKGRHGLVYNANDPSAAGAAVRKVTGIEAAK